MPHLSRPSSGCRRPQALTSRALFSTPFGRLPGESARSHSCGWPYRCCVFASPAYVHNAIVADSTASMFFVNVMAGLAHTACICRTTNPTSINNSIVLTVPLETHCAGTPTPLTSTPRPELDLIHFGEPYPWLVLAPSSVPLPPMQAPSPFPCRIQSNDSENSQQPVNHPSAFAAWVTLTGSRVDTQYNSQLPWALL